MSSIVGVAEYGSSTLLSDNEDGIRKFLIAIMESENFWLRFWNQKISDSIILIPTLLNELCAIL